MARPPWTDHDRRHINAKQPITEDASEPLSVEEAEILLGETRSTLYQLSRMELFRPLCTGSAHGSESLFAPSSASGREVSDEGTYLDLWVRSGSRAFHGFGG